jgi:hypothetical protein
MHQAAALAPGRLRRLEGDLAELDTISLADAATSAHGAVRAA